MHDASIRRAFWQGARDSLPFLIVIVPFGMIFGVLAAEGGWTMAQTLGMSVLVIAGASQFTALQLLEEAAPLAIVIATSLAVNLRMAMYSASLAPYIGAAPPWRRALAAYFLTDQTYGVAIGRYTRQPPLGPGGHIAYFLGCALPVCGPWYLATWAGAAAGAAIPEALALDFAVPVTFIALVAPGLRTLPNLAAAVVSVAVALALSWLPYSLGLLVAALAAMLTGALVERRQERRR
jgi:predicted branched-subunit amino acid permease